MSRPQQQQADSELSRLKQRIAEVVAERDALKQAIESGHLEAAEGVRRLEPLDTELSALDTSFKQRWDTQQ
jgi:predicted nuclease with TOPRIM domain